MRCALAMLSSLGRGQIRSVKLVAYKCPLIFGDVLPVPIAERSSALKLSARPLAFSKLKMKKTHRITKVVGILSAISSIIALVAIVDLFARHSRPVSKLPTDRHVAAVASVHHSPDVEKMSAPEKAPAAPAPIYSATVAQVLPGVSKPVSNWREFKPKQISIAPFPDTTFTFEQTGVKEVGELTQWTGRNSLQGAFLVSTATEHEWHGIVAVPGGSSFDIHISGDKVVVKEQSSTVHCGNISDRGGLPEPEASLAGTAATLTPTADVATSSAGVSVVDVEVFYNASALAEAGSVAAIMTRGAADILYADLCAEQSGVNVRWNYLGCARVPDYQETDNMGDDLSHVESFNGSRAAISDPVAQFAYDKCVAVGADQAVLYVGGSRGGVWGVAYTVDFSGQPYHYSCVLWNSDHTVFAHEAAHNFGCRHDRITEAGSSVGAYDGDGRYFYGYRFNFNGMDSGTVMSYAANRWPYYSNPNITANGVQMGLPMTDPRAAYNAAVINSRAATMANYRTSTMAAPVITVQPQATSITAGSSCVLTVTASGSNLSYQWYFNGGAVTGATSAEIGATYGGSYYVVVSNSAGSVASSTVGVTVSAGVSVAGPLSPGSGNPSSGWKFFKLEVTQLAPENSWAPIFQMSELKLYSQNSEVSWPTGTTVSAIQSGAVFPANESPSNLIDSNVQTKYCEVGNAANAVLLFTLGQPITNVDAFSMVNGNDTQSYPNRVPTGWNFYGSTDGISWTLLTGVANWIPTTFSNYAEQQRFTFGAATSTSSSSSSSGSSSSSSGASSSASWKFFKFQVTDLALENSWIPIFQMSELKLYSQNTAVTWPAGTTATAIHSGSYSSASESPASLTDSNVQTKYCEVGNAANTTILFTLGQPITNVDAFSLVNGNDTQSYPNRIPRGWNFYGSSDGTNWTLLANASGWVPSTTANYAELQKISLGAH